MPLRAIARPVLVALVLVLPACREAAERIFRPPEAAFRGVRIGGLGVNGATLEVTLALRNPNPYRLTANGATYRLIVEDSVEVGQGALREPFSVGGNDSTTVQLPIDVDFGALQRGLRGAGGDGEVEYRVVGTIDADTPVGGHAVPLNARGRAKVPRLFR